MNAAADMPGRRSRAEEPGTDDAHPAAVALRWAICLALVAALHVSVAWLAMRWIPAAGPTVQAPEAAVMIDLAPAVVPPSPPPKPPPEPIGPPPAPPPPPEPIAPPPPPPPPPPEAVVPPAPPEIVPPVPLPQPTPSSPPKPVPKPPVKPRAEPSKPRPQPVPHQLSVPPAVDVPSPAISPPPASAPSAAAATQNWQVQVLGRLERSKRYPDVARMRHQQGIVYLRFSMDRRGNVLSAHVERSSGVEALDQETLALIRRAAPLPAPPPEVAGDPVELVVPVVFSLR